ncbi:glutamate 5-kinase [Tetragenococcus koreensis]|uniref:Glutamate 5-kinase n=1 Tax=Tetragenococcus koreensis TaxID=290335 RepID=A0AAN4UC35_9ENTE|nr:glutamate 5-kinase [Tetragenococcus koreensis]MCF1616950.1 glutamate 5-kinase [Tetragenococcus koreensis]MCF1619376.1 glutamate 5-kinase [Tetragenococcus koreensis]MCF1621847.1 glutamate 5-kinase [Tetragenococcus koreensis]MCF1626947.1 glutamate 5-kinase [Tetragenococcus koreensis]MCF1631687.1 glutamate 5-kinase [Tetragenococcus koreensis]
MCKENKDPKRIVVKVGTTTLIYPNGNINLGSIDELAFVLSDLKNRGKEIILVSSGAIGVGLNQLQLNQRPVSIPKQQAVAAVGQAELMDIYNQRFQVYSQQIAQVLLTRDIVEYPESRNNVINTLEELLSMGIIPIINENDTVAVDELDHLTRFGDNDRLSTIVSELTHAELLIMLSDIDGFYSDNPLKNTQAKLHRRVTKIDDDLMKQAGASNNQFGTGGMVSKLKAAKRVLDVEGSMVLANGKRPKVIFDILNGADIGTLFKGESS